MYAPIALFVYKRLNVLKETIKKLELNSLASLTDLYIFSDGAKSSFDAEMVNDVRKYLTTISGFKSITIYNAPSNKGLANSIISGVSAMFEQSERIIVLEDDIEVSVDFLDYMNCCLDKYQHDSKVFSISGFSLPFKHRNDYLYDIYFLNRSWSWGWATWKNRWVSIDWEVKDYPLFLLDKTKTENFAKGGSDLLNMLKKSMMKKIDSWAIRWVYHQFKVDGLTVFPKITKVVNSGFNEDATHTSGSYKRFKTESNVDSNSNNNYILPDKPVIENYYQNQLIEKFSLQSRILSKFDSLLNKYFKS